MKRRSKNSMHTVKIISLISFLLFTFSCKKEEENLPPPLVEEPDICSEKENGYFNISLLSKNYEMTQNEDTHFSILYNWFGEKETNFVIYAVDQNDDVLNIELSFDGKFKTGSTTYTAEDIDADFFGIDIDVDTFNLYTSEVKFNITEINLIPSEGIYRPIIGTFEGVTHSSAWSNGEAPIDTINFNGSFCLNGVILK